MPVETPYYQSSFSSKEVEQLLKTLNNWAHAGFATANSDADTAFDKDTVTIDNNTYAVVWQVAPTNSNTVFGLGLDKTTGRIYEITSTLGVLSAVALDANADTLNTAGSGNSTNKLFIIGAKSQAAEGVQTYSNAGVYIENGKLHSNSTEVLTAHQNEYGKIKVGNTTTTADAVQDTITFVAGGDLSASIAGDTITYSYSAPQTLKNPHSLGVKVNNESSNFISYDGSVAKTITVKSSSTAGALIISDGTTEKTVQLAGVFTDNDTKDTAGSSDTTAKIYLIGAAAQSADGVTTYSSSEVFVNNDKLTLNNDLILNNSTISNGTYKFILPTVTANQTLATESYVAAAIDALPEAMVFKGTLGTGGTITALPTAAAGNEGWTYKVITAGTYASQAAKVGDTFICAKTGTSTYEWVIIPSGDEPNGTVTSVATGVGLTGGPITTSGTIKVNLVNETKSSNTASYAAGGSSNFYAVQLDANDKLGVSVPWTDKKAASGNVTSKLFLIGASSQSTSGVDTYSNSKTYTQNGCLYSNDTKVMVEGGAVSLLDNDLEFVSGLELLDLRNM